MFLVLNAHDLFHDPSYLREIDEPKTVTNLPRFLDNVKREPDAGPPNCPLCFFTR
jgi:hypothetical protein